MTNFDRALESAGMKAVDAYRLGRTIAQYVQEGRKDVLAKVFDRAYEAHQHDGPLALCIIRLEEQAERERVHLLATGLVDAIQSEDTSRLAQAIAHCQKIAVDDNRLANSTKTGTPCQGYIDAELANSGGLTALHAACGNYKIHHGKREVFDTMAGMLLKAGANPFKPVGVRTKTAIVMGKPMTAVVDPGRTIAQVCRGEIPPSLATWLSEHQEPDDARVLTYRTPMYDREAVELEEVA